MVSIEDCEVVVLPFRVEDRERHREIIRCLEELDTKMDQLYSEQSQYYEELIALTIAHREHIAYSKSLDGDLNKKLDFAIETRRRQEPRPVETIDGVQEDLEVASQPVEEISLA